MSLEITSSSLNRISIEELFFSITDSRGVISSGNEVFQRISGFEWPELLNAPHKIVRNPEMPKAVFHLLWATIKTGEPIGAYICNMTKGGEFYWVFATIIPADEGYLSVRMKPTSGLLEKVVPIYEELREREQQGALAPEQSAEILQQKICELGYFSYAEFCAKALTQELESRQSQMGRPQNETLMVLGKTLESTGSLESSANSVQGVFKDTHQIPYNMRLQAGRIEGSDGPISVISGNHRQMSQGLETIVLQFRKASQQSSNSVCASSMQIALAQVLEEMRVTFQNEADDLPRKKELLESINKYAQIYHDKSFDTLNETAVNMRRFRKQCRHMRRALSGLELTRIMCKIERFKIDGDHSGLDEIVTRLAYAQKALETSCDEIENYVGEILSLAEDLLRRRVKVAA